MATHPDPRRVMEIILPALFSHGLGDKADLFVSRHGSIDVISDAGAMRSTVLHFSEMDGDQIQEEAKSKVRTRLEDFRAQIERHRESP